MELGMARALTKQQNAIGTSYERQFVQITAAYKQQLVIQQRLVEEQEFLAEQARLSQLFLATKGETNGH